MLFNIKTINKNKTNNEINLNIPIIKKINDKNLNTSLIDYENYNYLYFLEVNDKELKIDNSIKNAINFDENKFYYLYYEFISYQILENNLNYCFLSLNKQYNLKNIIFSLKDLLVLRNAYDNEKQGLEKKYLLERKTLIKLKKLFFISFDKDIDTYRCTKKGKNFLFEFNSFFWLEKYKKNILKYNKYYKEKEKVLPNLIFDLKKDINKERNYILNI